MSRIVIVGGSNGLGFAILKQIHKIYDEVFIIDLSEPLEKLNNITYIKFDLFKDDLTNIKDVICSADSLIITAGIGQVKSFSDISDVEINKIYKVNTLSSTILIKYFYENLLQKKNAKCLIVSSIAGEVSSPLFATYGASKAAISKLCESLNIELEKEKSNNRITCITAVSFQGSSFNGDKTDVELLRDIAKECVEAMDDKETKHFINHNLCVDIIDRYITDRVKFGKESYEYKEKSGRVKKDKNYKVGYLSGTFDLFHIGHLNILKRAKESCDYLIVGVHESGSWKGKETFIPFEERLDIVRSIKYVDKAEKSFDEDSDAWEKYHYDILFVGSDYKGSERFKRYEKFFKDKGVKIVYFPYTKGTSSTQLREALSKK